MYDYISLTWLHISGLITYRRPSDKPWHLQHICVGDTTVHRQAGDMYLITTRKTMSCYCVGHTWSFRAWPTFQNIREGKWHFVDTLISFEIQPWVPWNRLANSRCHQDSQQVPFVPSNTQVNAVKPKTRLSLDKGDLKLQWSLWVPQLFHEI